MRFMKYFIAMLFSFSVFLSHTSLAQTKEIEKEDVNLFTIEEAEKLRLTEEEWLLNQRINLKSIPAGIKTNAGPRIVIKFPELKDSGSGTIIETVSPTDLFVFFEKNQSPVDMESLKIIAKKGIFSRSLTKRLRPYIHEKSLQVKKLKIPEGKFLIQITIADQHGVKSYKTWLLHVKKSKSK